MSELASVIGVLGTIGVMLFISFRMVKDEHWVFRMLTLFFVLAMLLLIPRATETQFACQPLLNQTQKFVNQTTVANNATSYENTTLTYGLYCWGLNESNDLVLLTGAEKKSLGTTPSRSLFRGALWYYRLVIAYLFLYIAWTALKYFRDSYKGDKQE